MMREATFAHPLDKAFQRYTFAVEQLRKVAHYHDRELMGRECSESEAKEFERRKKAVDDALHAICAAPCSGLGALRRKAKALNACLKDQSLGHRNLQAFFNSIFQMSGKGDVG